MNIFYQRYEYLCSMQDEAPNSVAKKLGIPSGSVTAWKNGATPRINTLKKLADHFSVTTDYLLGNDETKTAPILSHKDERDIEKRLEAMLGELEGPTDGLMFSGNPLDDETRELLRISLKNQLELSKQIAKQKFTPKKHRKKEGE